MAWFLIYCYIYQFYLQFYELKQALKKVSMTLSPMTVSQGCLVA